MSQSINRLWLYHGSWRLLQRSVRMDFELGQIPEHATEMRAATNFLVANYGRQKIIAIPRAVPKVAIFEEARTARDFLGQRRRIAACSSIARSANKAAARITNEQRMENARSFTRPVLLFRATTLMASFEIIVNMKNIANMSLIHSFF